MGQFLRNITDGSLRCRFCGDNECTCMEDGITELNYIRMWEYPNSVWVEFKKQKLVGGKRIPSRTRINIKQKDITSHDKTLKKIFVQNLIINSWVFDP